jgi:hypothetical protein
MRENGAKHLAVVRGADTDYAASGFFGLIQLGNTLVSKP